MLSEIAVMEEMHEGLSMNEFLHDERTARAVSMTLINIGELVKSVSDALKSEYPEIPWRAVAGMRDVTAHKYQTLRKEDVFRTCVDDMPLFEKQIIHLFEE